MAIPERHLDYIDFAREVVDAMGGDLITDAPVVLIARSNVYAALIVAREIGTLRDSLERLDFVVDTHDPKRGISRVVNAFKLTGETLRR